jgi:hypothetical protein
MPEAFVVGDRAPGILRDDTTVTSSLARNRLDYSLGESGAVPPPGGKPLVPVVRNEPLEGRPKKPEAGDKSSCQYFFSLSRRVFRLMPKI